MFIRFDTIHERDGHTDRQADRQTPHDDTGRACIASRGKKESETTMFAALCVRSELGMRRVHPWGGLGRVGSGWVTKFSVLGWLCWVGFSVKNI